MLRLTFCVFCCLRVWFSTGHFVMVPLNFTQSTLFTTCFLWTCKHVYYLIFINKVRQGSYVSGLSFIMNLRNQHDDSAATDATYSYIESTNTIQRSTRRSVFPCCHNIPCLVKSAFIHSTDELDMCINKGSGL